ncbi:MAG TPA: hypothetical protein VEY12_06150 [Thermoplasmata archaeon]|nr:hypothetical protein [Thermoplasmata archaeon]
MSAAGETIRNRDSRAGAWPSWVRSPLLVLALLFAIVGIGYLAGFPRWMVPVGWFYLGVAALFVVEAWALSVSRIDIGPDVLRIRYNGRSRAIPMTDILTIEAHRHWQNPLMKAKPPDYWFKLRRAKGSPLRVEYVRPEAGDRILLALYRRQKPITVYNWT